MRPDGFKMAQLMPSLLFYSHSISDFPEAVAAAIAAAASAAAGVDSLPQ
jgi:hypothetical protein